MPLAVFSYHACSNMSKIQTWILSWSWTTVINVLVELIFVVRRCTCLNTITHLSDLQMETHKSHDMVYAIAWHHLWWKKSKKRRTCIWIRLYLLSILLPEMLSCDNGKHAHESPSQKYIAHNELVWTYIFLFRSHNVRLHLLNRMNVWTVNPFVYKSNEIYFQTRWISFDVYAMGLTIEIHWICYVCTAF